MSIKTTQDVSLRLTGAAVAVGLAALPMAAQAAFVAPLDLNPGDPYRILFTTQGNTHATSADIATYDAFVTAEAALNPDLPALTWQAVVSTTGVAARDHVACLGACATAPIYNTIGLRVANNEAELWTSANLYPNWNTVDLPWMSADQYGNSSFGFIGTGSNNDGTAASGYEFGSSGGLTVWGWDVYGPSVWMNYLDTGQENSFQLYALSTFSAATDTPEPLSAALLASGLAVLAAARKRRAARAA